MSSCSAATRSWKSTSWPTIPDARCFTAINSCTWTSGSWPCSTMGEVFWTALKLGLTSFGGPIAHLGYFEQTYVRKLHWLASEENVQLVALCQTLPGPTSSQVGILVGLFWVGW